MEENIWNTHVEDRNPSPKPSKQSFTVLKLSEANFALGLKNKPIRAIYPKHTTF